MSDKEKLVELLSAIDGVCPKDASCYDCEYKDRVHCAIPAKADFLIANGVRLEEKQATSDGWISVKDRLPEPETEVLILAERKSYSFKAKSATTHHIVTTGMYEDGKRNTEDSEWWWYDHDFKYDEELDAYIIPEGWWEYKHYNGDDEHNHPIDDVVTHWMPLPKGE